VILSIDNVEQIKQRVNTLINYFVEIQNENSGIEDPIIENALLDLQTYARENKLVGLSSLIEHILHNFLLAEDKNSRPIELSEECLIFINMLLERPDAKSGSSIILGCLNEAGWNPMMSFDDSSALCDVIETDAELIFKASELLDEQPLEIVGDDIDFDFSK